MRKEQETKKGKDNIKTAFIDLYRTTPLNKIKINDIVSLAGISRSTFYFYGSITFPV